jgi:hypothetical protein
MATTHSSRRWISITGQQGEQARTGSERGYHSYHVKHTLTNIIPLDTLGPP